MSGPLDFLGGIITAIEAILVGTDRRDEMTPAADKQGRAQESARVVVVSALVIIGALLFLVLR